MSVLQRSLSALGQPAQPKPAANRVKVLSESQAAALVAAAAGERHEARDRAILELLYGAGLRAGELCSLDVRSVDLARGLVTVTGKGRKVRTVPLGRHAVEALRACLGERRQGPCFLTEQGAPFSNRLLERIVSKYAIRAGLPRISPHTLRHSAASHMLRRGAYLFSVSQFLGHALAATTAIYCHRLGELQPLQAVYQSAHPRA